MRIISKRRLREFGSGRPPHARRWKVGIVWSTTSKLTWNGFHDVRFCHLWECQFSSCECVVFNIGGKFKFRLVVKIQ